MPAVVATSRRILSLFLLVIPAAYSQTCYVAPGQAADSHIVPCGSGTAACCQLGDTCLGDSACFNYLTGVTYLYGCTDSSYTAGICPWKCGADYTTAPYVGITYCPLNGGDIWSCTKPPSDDSTVQKQPDQDCASDSQVAFAGPATLQPILLLPSTAGGSTGYFSPGVSTAIPNYTPAQVPVNSVPSKPSTPEEVVPPSTTAIPTSKSSSITPPSSTASTLTTSSASPTAAPVTTSSATTAASSTSSSSSTSSISTTSTSSSSPSSVTTTSTTSSSTSSSTTSSAAASSSSAVAAPSSSSLSTGAKAGIGAGVAGGALFLLALGLLFFLWRRKKRSHEPVPQHDPAYHPTHEPKTPYQDHPPVMPSIAGVGGRSELPGDSPVRHSGKHLSSELGDTSSRFDSPAPTYTSWENAPRPGHHGVHELSTNF